MLKYVSCLWQLKNVTKSSSRNDTLGVTEVRGQVRQTCFPSGMINFHNMRFNTSHFSSRWSDSSSNRKSSLTSTKIFLLCLKDFFFPFATWGAKCKQQNFTYNRTKIETDLKKNSLRQTPFPLAEIPGTTHFIIQSLKKAWYDQKENCQSHI